MKEWILCDDGKDTPDTLLAIPFTNKKYEEIFGLKKHVREVSLEYDKAVEEMRELLEDLQNRGLGERQVDEVSPYSRRSFYILEKFEKAKGGL